MRAVSLGEDDNEDAQRVSFWLLHEDSVVVRAVATAVGSKAIELMVKRARGQKSWFKAAKYTWALAALKGRSEGHQHANEALVLLEKLKAKTKEALQLVSVPIFEHDSPSLVLFANCPGAGHTDG